MQTYQEVLERFAYESFPSQPVKASVKFEAIVAEILGTKQRRFGPMPSPEVQVGVREVVRANTERVHFFLPWGSSKQEDGAGIDVLEFMALKQLGCLKEGLARMGVWSAFTFRVEDLTDRYLFATGRDQQIEEYRTKFIALASKLIGGVAIPESWLTTWETFASTADSFVGVFYRYLSGYGHVDQLREIGWTGDIPEEQQEYYYSSYRTFYPGANHTMILSRYFAATLARVKLGATAAPKDPSILIAFTHPVPANPVGKTRLHYRTIPDRFTHQHRSPWLASGHFEITDSSSEVSPRYTTPTDPDVIENTLVVGGVEIGANYKVVG